MYCIFTTMCTVRVQCTSTVFKYLFVVRRAKYESKRFVLYIYEYYANV